ncbi:MAG: ATP-binding protein [Acidobacteriota bacterium]
MEKSSDDRSPEAAGRRSTQEHDSLFDAGPAGLAPDEDERPQVRIAVGSRFDQIDLVQVVVDDALARLGLPDDPRHWVGIAIREAVANAIKHGNRQDPEKKVEVELAVRGDEAVIRVADAGAGFEPAAVADPLEPENLLKPNGRGIFYMRNFMDVVEYVDRPGGGTIVVMRKRLSALSESPEPA